jgi:AcrR family transcriptional regulator
MARPATQRKPAAARDPARTRERIIAAALAEFADRGLAGARVDGIARRAGVNKRMLYHYFGGKQELFRTLVSQKVTERSLQKQAHGEELARSLPLNFLHNCQDVEWVRLLAWESLQTGDDRVENEPERRQMSAQAQKRLRRQQAEGRLPADLPVACLHLALVSLAMFPVAMPQLTRLIVGRRFSDPQFQRDYAESLKKMAAALCPPPADVKP